MKRVNDYLMLLLPIGVLIISSYTFGTMSFVKLKGLLLYISASVFYLFFISFIAYPAILTSISKINYRTFLQLIMPPAMVAFSTGSVFLALPVIYNLMYKFDDDMKSFAGKTATTTKANANEKKYFCPVCASEIVGDICGFCGWSERGRNLIRIIVPLTWVVPASYKFLVIFFITFAHWYYDYSFDLISQLVYYIGGIPCLFGNNSVIVPFLVKISGLPSKAYDIFMLISNFQVYLNNANGAIFIIVLSILSYLSITCNSRLNIGKLITILIGSFLLFSAVVLSLNFLMTKMLSDDKEASQELAHMNTKLKDKYLISDFNVEYLTLDKYRPITPLDDDENLFEMLSRTKTLQIGYNPEAAPFSFFNKQGGLIGLDVDVIYELARTIGCNNLEFYPIKNLEEYEDCLKKGMQIPICIGGIASLYSPRKYAVSSIPYLKLTNAVVIPQQLHKEYKDFESVLPALHSGKLRGCTFVGIRNYQNVFVKKLINSYKLEALNNYSEFYRDKKYDVLFTSAETAYTLNIIYPGHYIYTYPQSDLGYYFGYLMPACSKADAFRLFINDVFIPVGLRNGDIDSMYKYWVMGETPIEKGNTWSVLSYLQSIFQVKTNNTKDSLKMDSN